jgi:hypothetical protein
MSTYQPKTGAKCGCRPGVQRDNCARCEGTGMVIDFQAIRARGGEDMTQPTKHTPGPWKAVRDETRNAYAWNVEGAPGIVPVIARLALIDAGAQIEPNAHLIAAAPAMYEALSRLRNVASTASNHMRLSGNEEEALLFDNDQRVVEAALAQADGKQ